MLEKLKGKERLIRDWEQINFYKVLRINYNATNEEILFAYEKRKKFWECRNRDDYLKVIELAKETLLDPAKKAQHNENLKRAGIEKIIPNNFDEEILNSTIVWKDRMKCEEALNKDAIRIKTNIKILTIIALISSIIIVPGLRWNVFKELFFVATQLFKLIPIIIAMVFIGGAIWLIYTIIRYFILGPIKNMFKSFKNIKKTNKELNMMKKGVNYGRK